MPEALVPDAVAGVPAMGWPATGIAPIAGPAPKPKPLELQSTAIRLRWFAAAKALATSADPNTQAVLKAQSEPANEAETEVRRAAFQSYLAVKDRLTLAENIGRVFSGLSLGSILLLAALGLAITYGVMGVINMAHGELLMIGAYAFFSFTAGLGMPWWAAIPAALTLGK